MNVIPLKMSSLHGRPTVGTNWYGTVRGTDFWYAILFGTVRGSDYGTRFELVRYVVRILVRILVRIFVGTGHGP